ncbi:helix-turn-helix domain-containing protein [Streptomyces sp. NPDC002328]|uniref:helix-turn-helix domain-containing protein n=1 Tax=Streptomyces sp. NPDC002328 TaxID=3364642 RepID=UPI00367FBF18
MSVTAAPGDPSPPPGLVVVGHFDQAAGYGANRPGGSDSWLFTWTTGGLGRLRQGGTEVRARPGDLVALAPGVPHRYSTEPGADRWRFWWAHCQARPAWTQWLHPYGAGDGVYVVPAVPPATHPRIEAAFSRMHTDARRPAGITPTAGPHSHSHPHTPASAPAPAPTDQDIAVALGAVARELALCALEEAVLLATATAAAAAATAHAHASATASRVPPGVDGRVRRAQERIAADPGAPHTVRSLAREAALSPSRFAHLFTEHVGQSPMRALREARLRHAARLLESTGLSVERVATAAGFASPFHFSRLFRARHGMPPGAYRDGMRAAIASPKGHQYRDRPE